MNWKDKILPKTMEVAFGGGMGGSGDSNPPSPHTNRYKKDSISLDFMSITKRLFTGSHAVMEMLKIRLQSR